MLCNYAVKDIRYKKVKWAPAALLTDYGFQKAVRDI